DAGLELGQAPHRAEERAHDAVVGAVERPGVGRERLGHREPGGREQPGVVEEADERVIEGSSQPGTSGRRRLVSACGPMCPLSPNWHTAPAGRPGGADAALPPGGRGPAQAPHPVPRPRRQPLRRGAHGRRRLLVGLGAALPPPAPPPPRRARAGPPAPRRRRRRPPRRPPPALVGAETVRPPAGDGAGVTPNEPLLPRHFRTGELEPGGDLVGGRWLLLANDDVRLLAAAATEPSGLYRNATGDEIVF